jgi:molybdenum cofactor cytidylyltransferase
VKSVAAIILAAGRSSRMGRDKRLLVVAGRRLLDHAIEAARGAGLSPILVVRGPMPLGLADVTEIANPEPERGMGRSLALGLAALPSDLDGVVILLADMPGVTAAHVNQLVDAFDGVSDDHLVVPTCGGQRGNPVLIGRPFWSELAGLDGDQGARILFQRYPGHILRLEMDHAVLQDMDTPQDLARWEAR